MGTPDIDEGGAIAGTVNGTNSVRYRSSNSIVASSVTKTTAVNPTKSASYGQRRRHGGASRPSTISAAIAKEPKAG